MPDPSARLAVERITTTSSAGRIVSALRWGRGEPEIVLLHGGAQNAHTWDAVAIELRRPLLCIDLPGHGRSAWRDDHDYRPPSMVDDVSEAISALAPRAQLIGGMSLGGMTALALAGARPELVPRLTIVDIAPGSGRTRSGPLFSLIDGPEVFPSLDAITDWTAQVNPTRSRDSLQRAIRHNAIERPDGTWRWRYDPTIGSPSGVARVGDAMLDMWETIDRIDVPTLLVLGANSSAVTPGDIDEWKRRQPGVHLAIVEEAGHAVQTDQPSVLARLVSDFLEIRNDHAR